jgi:hypothetical protein
MEKFHFTIARKWDDKKPLSGDNICKYMIHNSDIHYGTMENAKSCLDYVLSNNEKDYKILKITFSVVDS